MTTHQDKTTHSRTSIYTTAIWVAITSTISHQTHANDGAYYMSGNQLVPMIAKDIDVTHEKLDIKRITSFSDRENDNQLPIDDIAVDVHYELNNRGKEQSMIVGFEALPAFGDARHCPINGKHPYMKDFTVKINGKPVDYKVAMVKLEDTDTYIQEQLKTSAPYFVNSTITQKDVSDNCYYNEFDLFVYYFDADFKKGKNTIDHSYRFEASGGVDSDYTFDYVLTAINRWGDGNIDDFVLTIDMGKNTRFDIKNSFFNTADDWQLTGKVKAYPTETQRNYFNFISSYGDNKNRNNKNASTTFAMYDGKITFAKKNFTPKDEIYLASPQLPYGDPKLFEAKTDTLSFNYQDYILIRGYEEDFSKLSTYSKKILRNYPFAKKGYVFKSPEIQAYYDKQPWYIPNPAYKANLADLNDFEQKMVQRFLTRSD